MPDGAIPGQTQQREGAKDDSRLAWWRDAKFGMFIHWGLYAIPASEWIMKREFRGHHT